MTNTEPKKEIAEVKQERTPLAFQPGNTNEAYRMAKLFHKGGVASNESLEVLTIKIIKGVAMGIDATEAIDAFSIIKGKICLTASAQLARAQSAPDYAGMHLDFEGDGDSLICKGAMKRHGHELPYTAEFSIADAKNAGIYNAKSAWGTYPKDMLRARVISRLCRLTYADRMFGMTSDLELKDGMLKGEGTDEIVETISEAVADLPSPDTTEEQEPVVEPEVLDAEQVSIEEVWQDLNHDMKMLIAMGNGSQVLAYAQTDSNIQAGLTELALKYETASKEQGNDR